jgi:cation diffusion facilitator family transporter
MNSANMARQRFSRKSVVTEQELKQERSVLRAIILDLGAVGVNIVAAIASGSITVLADLLRAGLMLMIEIASWVTMWRGHHGKFVAFEYGIGKIERIATIIIAGGLLFSATYTVAAAWGRLSIPEILPTPGMIFAVIAASYNFAVNLYCAVDFARANQKEGSLILGATLKARISKLVNSGIVVLVLLTASWLSDPKGATMVDVAGALLATGFMVWTAVRLLRESLPDLMDRSLPEHDQLRLLSVVARHFDKFDQFEAVRSRQSGGRAYVDMELEFERMMPLREVQRRCVAIENEIVELIPNAIVNVTPRVAKD